jgi:hypothetical protein
MTMRLSTRFLLLTLGNLALLAVLGLHARHVRAVADAGRSNLDLIIRGLGLTDLCLTTEAPHSRHPALAGRHTPFQDHPCALDHFPSGSLIPPAAARPHEPRH